MYMDIDIVPCDYSGMCPYVNDGHSCEDRCGGTKQEGEHDNESKYLLQTTKEI